jgi:E3 ubiquitin-protein ligase NEDD4
VQWFHDTCAKKLHVDWGKAYFRMNVRHGRLLEDSFEAVMSMTRKDLRKVWKIEYIGERGISGGRVCTEWFYCVCQEMFDPNRGFWQPSGTNRRYMTINPASGM